MDKAKILIELFENQILERWRTYESRDVESIIAVLNQIHGYNEFQPKALAKEIEKWKDEVSAISIGEEGTFVIYVTIPCWGHQKIKPEKGRRLTEDERNQIAHKVMESLRRAKADEVSWDGYKVRGWWD
jgi:hypothetical protein